MNFGDEMIPYTYLIGWTQINKVYYGVQYGKKSNPDNLFVNYFTSSDVVKVIHKRIGPPDIIKIRKIFSDPKKAKDWEEKVLRRVNAVKDSKWLNMQNAGKYYIGGSNKGRILSDEWKKKNRRFPERNFKKLTDDQRESARQRMLGENNPMSGKTHYDEVKQAQRERMIQNNPMDNEESRLKLSLSKKGPNHPYFGQKLSLEHSQKLSESKKGKIFTEEHKQKLSDALKGRVRTDSHRKALSIAFKNSLPIICEHCGKSVDVRNYGRWHGG